MTSLIVGVHSYEKNAPRRDGRDNSLIRIEVKISDSSDYTKFGAMTSMSLEN